ncbi:hypothetical protein D6C84_07628 [Aureobasidium pullulans]|uniref:Uncharacterized protein n=1 Tax=Aureobasidium pullulans TaxID=5580 RepID=A0A4S9XN66_AURPU|nr:hypothetical protein D6C84_07628 [Aureobasidium pullulans]
MADSAGRDKPLSCQVCNKSFGRSEHLKRHVLTHTRSREYQCRICRKSFFRKDALSRHQNTHLTSGPNLLQRGGRACIACASSKTRCSGQVPCNRCQQRSLQCIYPEASIDQQGPPGGQLSAPYTIHSTADSNLFTNTPPQAMSDSVMAQTSQGTPSLPQVTASTVNFQNITHNQTNHADQYQHSVDATLNSSFVPNIYSTINWLGYEEGSNFEGGLEQDWQYPDQLFNFYMPASDTHSISQISQSPANYREVETSAGSDYVQRNDNVSTPWDIGTIQTSITDGSTPTPGEFYVDGGTARLPRMRKRRAMSTYALLDSRRRVFSMALPSDLTFPTLSWEWFDAKAYATLESQYLNICASSTSLFVPFESVNIPEKALFDYLCTLYVEHCNTVVPFLHIPTLKLRQQHWLLSLSMAAIGSHYLKGQESNTFVLSMHEFVRRLLVFAGERPEQMSLDFVTRYRVTLLHAIGSTYCGDESLRSQGLELQSKLGNYFKDYPVQSEPARLVLTEGTESNWHRWSERESGIRLKHCTWFLDCIWSFQFQTRTALSLSDVAITLPSNDKTWNTSSATEWSQLMQEDKDGPDLLTALDTLYISKTVPASFGEFSRVLLIYGLYLRCYLIGDLASGFEHTTVLHLHLARVTLLTPIREIVNLARYLAGEKGSKTESEITADRQAVQRWAFQHQYKARLASIHAGVVFWHVRRFSANAFYEPTAVAHAALVLWAFSAFSSKTAAPVDSSSTRESCSTSRGATAIAENDSSDSESSSDTIILLDRPADDEIVQEFVMNGPRMRANMTGVGDLYGEKGPERVLREGTKILKTLGCWRVWESWARVLDRLMGVCKRERKRARDQTGQEHTQVISIVTGAESVEE